MSERRPPRNKQQGGVRSGPAAAQGRKPSSGARAGSRPTKRDERPRKGAPESAGGQVFEQPMRLQKFLSDAGVASRREAEEMIADGRVSVNGVRVTRLPVFVDPRNDRVLVDGQLARAQPHEYFILHKPAGVVCTSRDPAGRPRAVDLVPHTSTRLFLVGRLDVSSTGLLLLTNDGELAQRLTHARFGAPKIYRAEVAGQVDNELIEKLKKGVYLEEGKTTADAEIVHRDREKSVLHLTLRGGRDRLVRQMLAQLGHRVLKLKRLTIGPLSMKGLPPGSGRRLTPAEVEELRNSSSAIPAHMKRHARRTAKRVQKGAGDGATASSPKKSPAGDLSRSRSAPKRGAASTQGAPATRRGAQPAPRRRRVVS